MFESIMDEYGVNYTRQMYNGTTEYKMPTEYTINTYARGMLMFYAISEMVGYENLNAALAHYAADHCYSFATLTTLTHALEDDLGYDLVKFMNNYLAGKQDSVL